MDLGAYFNIGTAEIEEIVKKNNIDVPRLRGYRLMKNEKPVSQEVLQRMCKDLEAEELEVLVSEKRKHYYIKNYGTDDCQVDWSRVHGWKRKQLKFAIKNFKRAVKEQYDMFNKYAGRNDILYIHSRIGGDNWFYYKHYVVNEPWFIERVDDAYDNTYCDIYARIKE